jgi:DNA-binding NtrC family response regulator
MQVAPSRSARAASGVACVVLVVQDHALREAMRDALSDEAFEVAEAASYDDGAELLRGAARGCVVVIDHPRTGEEAAACRDLLREGEGRSTLVWVAATAPLDDLADPRVPMVMMPFTTGELVEAVESAMTCFGGRRR